MTFKYFVILSTLLISLSFASCGGDDDVSCDDEAELTRILNNGATSVGNAIAAFNQDQSDSNCNNLKDAFNDWIDDLRRLQGCADEVGQGDEFRDAINMSRDQLDSLPC